MAARIQRRRQRAAPGLDPCLSSKPVKSHVGPDAGAVSGFERLTLSYCCKRVYTARQHATQSRTRAMTDSDTLTTYCPNCRAETVHEHEHGDNDGSDYCRVKCMGCGAEMEAESPGMMPPAHSASQAVRWAQK